MKNNDKKPSNPWNKTFDSARDEKGHLSREKLNRESHNNNLITVILVTIIVVIALISLCFGIVKNVSGEHNSTAMHHSAETSSKTFFKSSNDKKKLERNSGKHSVNSELNHPKKDSQKISTTSSRKESKTHLNSSNNSVDKGTNSNNNHQSSSNNSQSSATNGNYATVEPGQGIYRVAKNAGISMQQLMQLNNLSSASSIHPGEKLRIK